MWEGYGVTVNNSVCPPDLLHITKPCLEIDLLSLQSGCLRLCSVMLAHSSQDAGLQTQTWWICKEKKCMLCSNLFRVLPRLQPPSWASPQMRAETNPVAGIRTFGTHTSGRIKSPPEFKPRGQENSVVSEKLPIGAHALILKWGRFGAPWVSSFRLPKMELVSLL